jgi:AcrR family transcriptional regulator
MVTTRTPLAPTARRQTGRRRTTNTHHFDGLYVFPALRSGTMGYRHTREEILEAAVATVLEGGMAALTFSKVGARLGISDRTVVYYFASKTELVVAVTQAMGADLVRLLESAFGAGPSTPAELVATAWPVLTTGAADRVFALYFEIIGLASAGQAPYDELAHSLLDGWVQWLAPRLHGSTAEIRSSVQRQPTPRREKPSSADRGAARRSRLEWAAHPQARVVSAGVTHRLPDGGARGYRHERLHLAATDRCTTGDGGGPRHRRRARMGVRASAVRSQRTWVRRGGVLPRR